MGKTRFLLLRWFSCERGSYPLWPDPSDAPGHCSPWARSHPRARAELRSGVENGESKASNGEAEDGLGVGGAGGRVVRDGCV